MNDLTLILKVEELKFSLKLLVLTFLGSILVTPILTHFQFKFKLWKKPQEESSMTGEKTPIYTALHKGKHGKLPTLAGLMILIPVLIVNILFNLDRAETWLPLFTLFSAGILGAINDLFNVFGKSKIRGLKSSEKLLLQIIISGIGAWWFYFKLGWHRIHIPAFGDLDIGMLYIPFFMLVLISTSNAVNITDGLDGLAGGLLSMSFASFGAIAFFKGMENLAAFSTSLTGATLAYTWFNIFPARFLMGDSGSLSLGMTLGVIAMLTDSALILPITGGVFVFETLSVVLQLFWKKFFKRKLILSSPIHYHFQAVGWPETKVTMRFWVLGAVFAACGLILGLLGGGNF